MGKIYELLAPAGDETRLIAAVNAGADAVYLGGEAFNARVGARNFRKDEIIKALDFAHARDIKVYIAMNTLLNNQELSSAFEYAEFLYKEGADALIIQDLGLAALVKEHLPGIDMHLSTQGTIYSKEGAIAAQKLGFARIVLARELTIEEINDISVSGDIEIEAFVHGALCICYSGQCQMSRHIGGRSGNMGSCAQPCRLYYETGVKKPAYVLSPKDLCALDFLETLGEAGVFSFKIEGRMKSPEYVGIVTSIYKKYLDMLREGKPYTISPDDRHILCQIFNRGFTGGYFHGNKGVELMATDLPKHIGVHIGHVNTDKENGQLVDVAILPGMTVKLGDGIEIRAKQLIGNVITYHKTLPQGVLRLGDIKGKTVKGDEVYKITDKELMKSAAAFFDGTKVKKTGINMEFRAALFEYPVLEVSDDSGERAELVGINKVREAENKELTEELVIRQLEKTGGTPFEIKNINVQLEKGGALSVSELNFMRREALAVFEAKKTRASKRSLPFGQNPEIRCEVKTEPFVSLFFYQGKSVKSEETEEKLAQLKAAGVSCDDVKIMVPLYDFMEGNIEYEGAYELMPYILNVSKGGADAYIRANLDRIIKKTKGCGIAIGNIGWAAAFASRGVFVYGDYGLNLMNAEAYYAAMKLGIKAVMSKSLETGVGNFGRLPLMISEHIFEKTYIIDRKGKKYTIIKNEFGDKSIILSDEIPIDAKAVKKIMKSGGAIRIYCA